MCMCVCGWVGGWIDVYECTSMHTHMWTHAHHVCHVHGSPQQLGSAKDGQLPRWRGCESVRPRNALTRSSGNT